MDPVTQVIQYPFNFSVEQILAVTLLFFAFALLLIGLVGLRFSKATGDLSSVLKEFKEELSSAKRASEDGKDEIAKAAIDIHDMRAEMRKDSARQRNNVMPALADIYRITTRIENSVQKLSVLSAGTRKEVLGEINLLRRDYARVFEYINSTKENPSNPAGEEEKTN